jgi:mRNA-degrading endonuclease toxin of MazEF toxin-antitoxin module
MTLVDGPRFLGAIEAAGGRSLRRASQAVVDEVLALPLARIRANGGRGADSEMTAIEDALRHWLDL